MGVTLETASDRKTEKLAIDRFLDEHYANAYSIRFPQFAFCDYLVAERDSALLAVEVKVRKETPLQLQQYGGLWLRWKKYEELCSFEKMSNIQTIVLFAFENGEGEFRYCHPASLENPKRIIPKPRRNGRDAPGDFEPVIELDWDLDLQKRFIP